jgi:hypothetical protein
MFAGVAGVAPNVLLLLLSGLAGVANKEVDNDDIEENPPEEAFASSPPALP